MDEARPSRTAMRVAMRRAAHQLFDAPLVLDDPIAVPIIGPQALARIQGDRGARAGRLARTARAWMVARSRFAEDELGRAAARGVRQYVVLGAGLDTFGYRSPFPDLRVFEVDHPATQAWKRKRIASAGIAVPLSLTYVPVNFERHGLADCLQAAGFDGSAPAFFSWLGVVMYLTRSAIDATLGIVASTAPGGGLAFDYAVDPSLLDWRSRFVSWRLARRVAAAGEPFRTRFRPDALQRDLSALGFQRITDIGRDEINARYFRGRTDGVRVRATAGRLLSAEL
jgi:methyltransferase (TIGR00027 family)